MRYWKKFKEEHGLKANPDTRVGLSVATYKQGPLLTCLLDSVLAQTHKNFEVVVCHDGPWDAAEKLALEIRYGSDRRFHFVNTNERENTYGHNCRDEVKSYLCVETDYVGFCNGDVYYSPVYFEWMVAALEKQDGLFAYCNMIHSHQFWQPLHTELKRGKIDVGCFLVDSAVAVDVDWRVKEFAADWYFVADAVKGLKKGQVVKVPGHLYVHN